MRRTNEVFIYIVPFAVVAGFALSIAVGTPGTHTVAWCTLTGTLVVCLCLVISAFQMGRFTTPSNEDRERWPKELDLLLSGDSDQQRIRAARKIGQMGELKGYPSTSDARKVLQCVAESNVSDELQASVLGAWTALSPESCPTWVIEKARDPNTPPYVKSAALGLVTRVAALSLVNGTGQNVPGNVFQDETLVSKDSLYFFATSLGKAWNQAHDEIGKNMVAEATASMKSNPLIRERFKKTDRILEIMVPFIDSRSSHAT